MPENFSSTTLSFVLHAFDVLAHAFYAERVHVYELRGERRELARVHSKRIVHHEHVSVGEFAAADADGDAVYFAGNLFAEFFGNMFEYCFETAEAVHVLGGFFDGARFFFGVAFLLEVRCGLREKPEVRAYGDVLAAQEFDDAFGSAFELDACCASVHEAHSVIVCCLRILVA